MKKFAFDMFGTLTDHEAVRAIAREVHAKGHEVHIVSAISPGVPWDNDEWYTSALAGLRVPFTKIHRCDHDDNGHLKVEILRAIGNVAGFWDDLQSNVLAARVAGIPTCHVGVDPPGEVRVARLIDRRAAK